MQLEITIVDAFTDTLFKGNSAAVIITQQWLADDLMQSIAAENNLSETAFLMKFSDSEYRIRWFSPVTEIDFCGHATLASAFVLFSKNPTLQSVHFSAGAVGKMYIARADDGYITMHFPKRAPHPVAHIPGDLMTGLSIQPADVLRNNQAYFAIYEREEDIFNLKPDPAKLKILAPFDVVATARSVQYDFISRYFWPANGGVEDPVTGSIHTGLAPYWAEKLDKSRLTAFQASKRGGLLNCQVKEDRVIISGKAVQYLKGNISV
ncbi:PhzF family phenazine biosynthesis protein [Microbulbifer spongiae]|uniref:PhzF family phenazine biosynthesis protein n=1 Tax=Microbulbifer spongiae TaxID=2944933 RepID=A0ABY9E766_9GAMM|nr:PhzF family phenazine biosynthesis protein [Microbulbifer sp. MI-G]WKD48870.1 PhzF family phenazine biosynthesis protein [Microbulbifer sp. MI-G]